MVVSKDDSLIFSSHMSRIFKAEIKQAFTNLKGILHMTNTLPRLLRDFLLIKCRSTVLSPPLRALCTPPGHLNQDHMGIDIQPIWQWAIRALCALSRQTYFHHGQHSFNMQLTSINHVVTQALEKKGFIYNP